MMGRKLVTSLAVAVALANLSLASSAGNRKKSVGSEWVRACGC